MGLKEKMNCRTINFDYIRQNQIKSPNYIKISLLNSFRAESREKQRIPSDNKYDIINCPFNKIKISPSSCMISIRSKLKNINSKPNIIKTKSSFSKYITNNIVHKSPTLYFSESVNISEANKNKKGFYNPNKLKNVKTIKCKSSNKTNVNTKPIW